MLFTIQKKRGQPKTTLALAEASAMTKTEAANLAWAKKKGKIHLQCAEESFEYVWCFMFVDVHMANMDCLFSRGSLLFLIFFVVGWAMIF